MRVSLDLVRFRVRDVAVQAMVVGVRPYGRNEGEPADFGIVERIARLSTATIWRHPCAQRPDFKNSAFLFTPLLERNEGLVVVRGGVCESDDSHQRFRSGRKTVQTPATWWVIDRAR